MAVKISDTIIIDDNKNLVNVENVNTVGVVTATSFVGSGENLTGLPAGYTDLDSALFS